VPMPYWSVANKPPEPWLHCQRIPRHDDEVGECAATAGAAEAEILYRHIAAAGIDDGGVTAVCWICQRRIPMFGNGECGTGPGSGAMPAMATESARRHALQRPVSPQAPRGGRRCTGPTRTASHPAAALRWQSGDGQAISVLPCLVTRSSVRVSPYPLGGWRSQLPAAFFCTTGRRPMVGGPSVTARWSKETPVRAPRASRRH